MTFKKSCFFNEKKMKLALFDEQPTNNCSKQFINWDFHGVLRGLFTFALYLFRKTKANFIKNPHVLEVPKKTRKPSELLDLL